LALASSVSCFRALPPIPAPQFALQGLAYLDFGSAFGAFDSGHDNSIVENVVANKYRINLFMTENGFVVIISQMSEHTTPHNNPGRTAME
jgi:hypothetical protein